MSNPQRINGDYLVACPAENYESQFKEKQQRLRELLNWNGDIEGFDSPRQHFRFRTNFQMWHDDPKNRTPEGFYYSMYDEKDKNKPREITSFPPGTERINELMQQLRLHFKHPVIFRNLFEVRFVTTKHSASQCIIVLCYKQPLHPDWKIHARTVAEELDCKIIGRAKKEMQFVGGTFDDEYIQEILTIEGRDYVYFQTEGAFSQPNAYVCEKMITWALKAARPAVGGEATVDLLELYCGGGTFTAPFSTIFRKVLATEISKASVLLAKRCFEANAIENIHVLRLSSEEFTAWYEGKSQFERVKQAGVQISDFNITTVFVDPPRAGLDIDTCTLLKKFQKIVYVSCNPVTLARDVEILKETHDVLSVAAFDQFPYTHHLESGVLLVKRAGTESAENAKRAVDTNDADDQPSKRAKIDHV
jgi:tRNA (uracil-5-)-methyltransferase